MSGCPSREQLVNLVTDRTIEIEGFDLGAHTRSCPRCRELVRALSHHDIMESCLERPHDDTTVAEARGLSIGSPATLPDPSLTIDGINARFASSAAVDIPSSATAATWQSQADDVPSCAAFLLTTEVLTATDGAPLASSYSADTHQATPDHGFARGDATEDFSREATRGARNIRSGSVAASETEKTSGPVDYEILSELGRGGMGIVYKARDRRLNRLVALKMIRGGVHADEIQFTRFRIEAEAVAALRHPNILQIYDIGESDGLPYVALELLDGGSLAEKVRGTSLAPRKAAELMVPMALAMDAAHRAGIVHRDLKSVNILFTADGVPKITDFGLAKRLEMDEGHTHTGQVMGTPSYMAPEQARGDTKTVGPPADIYALGAILYEMLTGRPPFKGISAMDTVKQVIEVEPLAPSRVQFRVPRDLETICLKCLQKEARKRYDTARELADDLNRYLAGEPIRARRTPPIERGVKWLKRHPTYATLLTFAIVGVLSCAGTALWYWNHLRALERIAMSHEATLRTETADDLMHAQDVARKDLNQAKVILTSRKSILERENIVGLTRLYDRTNQKLVEIESAQAAERARDDVQNRYQRFLDRRKETLFRDTQFSGLMLAANLDLTRKAAEEALGVFARPGDAGEWTLGDLPASLSSEQQTEVKEGCYELLLVLAETLASEGPGHVDLALRALDGADRLRPGHSRAFHMTKASCLARQRDHAGEARELAEAERVRPETAFDYFLSGQQAYKRKRYPDAIQDFEIALRQKPDHFWAKCLQAICYIQTSRYEGAKSCLNDCLQTDRDFAWLYLLRGFASGQLGAKYQNLAKNSPGREAALNTSADFEFGEAEADLHEALERLRSTPDPDADLQYILLVNRGLVRFERDRLDQAAADYHEAVGLKRDPFLAHAELAHVYEKQGKPDLAIEQFTRAIALKPKWSPLYRGRAAVLEASGADDASRRAMALADLDAAIVHEKSDDPVLALDHTNRGKLLYRDDRFVDALQESKLALQIKPTFIDAHILQVQSLLKLRRYDELFRSCDAALAMGKKSAVLFELRGLAHSARHEYPAAIRDYGEALEIRPDDPGLLAKRGWVYLTVESPRLALVDFEASVKLNPADGDAYNGRGTARAMLGDHVAAVADAREAVRRGGASARVKYNAARIYAVAAAELGAKARQARQLSLKYQDIALQLIREEFAREAPEKRAAFWRETVLGDPALKAIRRRLNFDDLIVTIK
jgi:eukaryotic-like serine/threonine-protein kinase